MTARFLALLLFVLPAVLVAQKNYPPKLEGVEQVVYRETVEADLALWIFKPEDWQVADKRPAAVFFFGGGWKGGSPEQFVPQARALAARGMVAAVADYRVASRHQTLAKDCVSDAREAVRFLRSQAETLGVDPQRILAGGGSAGGHLAACLGTMPDDSEGQPSALPNALALFNPAVLLAPIDGRFEKEFGGRAEEFQQRMGVDPSKLSPVHHVQKGVPPTVIFHGRNDTTVPFVTVEIFAAKMKQAGNRCDLVGFAGKGHGFFNLRGKPNPEGEACIAKMDAFLVSLGWLDKPEG